MKIYVKTGDIAKVPSEALITAINSGGMWFGGIDGVIQKCAGNMFHDQAAAVELEHGKTVVAKSKRNHEGAFKDVVFVVDDLAGPLSEIVFNGLNAAAEAGYKTVTLPTIRMGVMLGQVEKTRKEAADQMVAGVQRFQRKKPRSSITKATFVVYVDPETEEILKRAFA